MAEDPIQRRKRDIVSYEEVYKALRRAGFSKDIAIKMTAVAGSESGYDLGIVRPSTASGTGGHNMLGLFQINTIHRGSSWFDKYGGKWWNLDNQARMAKAVYDAQGLDKNSWSSYGSSSYYDHLAKAKKAAESVGEDYDKSSTGTRKPGEKKSSPSKKTSKKTSSRSLNRNQMIVLAVVGGIVLLVVTGK